MSDDALEEYKSDLAQVEARYRASVDAARRAFDEAKRSAWANFKEERSKLLGELSRRRHAKDRATGDMERLDAAMNDLEDDGGERA